MSRDTQQDLAALRVALRSTLQTLASPLQPTEPSATPPSAAALHSTFLSLAQLLKSHTTTLSLALGKQPPTPHAALPYLAKIGDDWKRLAFVVRSCDERQPTSELRKEWSWAQDELRDALAGLLETFVDRLFPSAGASSSSPAAAVDNEKYLQKTGVVYGVVDRAVRGLSRTPLDSIAKRWENDADGLRDGEVEAREMVEDDDEDDGDGEDSDGDDGANDDGADGASDDGSEDDWAKLLGEAGAKPTAAERDVIRSILPLLRLTLSLHKHLTTAHLVPETPAPALQALLPLSTAVLTASDDLVSSLYAPLELAALPPLVAALAEAGRALARTATGQMAEGARPAKWVGLWEVQVGRVEQEVLAGLPAADDGGAAAADEVAQALEKATI